MKRAQLEVGKDYYYARSNNRWMEHPSEGTKVTIVDDGYWAEPRHTWSISSPTPTKVTSGTGILVDIVTRSFNTPHDEKIVRRVVSVTAIRGPYEETHKEVQARADEITKMYRAQAELSQKNDIEAATAMERALLLGINVYQRNAGTDRLIITTADLARLLQMAGK